VLRWLALLLLLADNVHAQRLRYGMRRDTMLEFRGWLGGRGTDLGLDLNVQVRGRLLAG
jgi:hypothetical protein